MERINSFVQPVKILNLILILICISGFVCQVYLIFSQYMLGKTVVNIEMKRLEFQPLPAITVCIPYRFELSKLSELSETNKILYQDYMSLINQSIDNKTFTEDVKKRLQNIYYKIKRNNTKITVNFDKLFDLSLTHESIDVNIFGQNNSTLNESLIQLLNGSFYVSEKPIDSFVMSREFDWEGLKCFTYFSALEQYWNQFRIDLMSIRIDITNEFTKYPPIQNEYYISIHSPNVIPSEIYYFSFKEKGFYSLKYSQMITRFLANGFQSNCVEYDIRKESGTIRMEGDCRVHCFASILIEASKDPLSKLDLVRKEHRSYFANISIPLYVLDDSYDFDLEDKVYKICFKRCKPDCNSRLYFTDINKIRDVSYLPHEYYPKYSLYFQHRNPDIIVRHTFEMTLMSFVCNFGGLLGMWLGFSVLSISKHIFKSIRHLISFDGNKINLFINHFTIFKNKFEKKIFINKSNASSNQNNLPMVEIN